MPLTSDERNARRDLVADTIIDDICCILAERDKMIEGICFNGLISEGHVKSIVRTREETAALLYRLISDAVIGGGTYVHMHLSDAKMALKNKWPELLVNAAMSIATSPFTTPDDLRELKKLMEEVE